MADTKIDAAESTVAEVDSAEAESDESEGPADPVDGAAGETLTNAKPPRTRRSISIGLRSLVVAVLIVVLAATAGTFAWLYVGADRKLDAQASESANDARVEQIALDYAVNAATMDFKDLQGWKVKLVAGTTPELSDKLSKAGDSMQQILVPLQWTSTAQPLVATVRSTAGGVFVVDCFVSVKTKTVQAAEALQSTATYSVTIDSNKEWQITDVGGIGSVVGK